MNRDGFDERLSRRGISRREFLRFCGLMAATLALESSKIGEIAEALAAAPRPPVLWLEFQDCTGDTESFLRASNPTVEDLILGQVSLDYHETLMVPSGAGTEVSFSNTIRNYAGKYLVIVEGSIPTAGNGIYCMIRGRTALSMLREAVAGAAGVIAAGSCAWDGGLAAAAPNPTGAMGVKGAVPSVTNFVGLPGCPVNAINLAATLTHYLTYKAFPARDSLGRPTAMYGDTVHHRCERIVFKEADRYVRAWGDQGHRMGWCFKEIGCKGPDTHSNCPVAKWNQGTSWPIGSGHHCIGCTEPRFWDRRSPFYR